VLALAAIAHPDLFVANAREAGAEVGATLFFPDHHEYSEEDLDLIRRVAAGRGVVTTAKDMVKLALLANDLELWILEQEVVVEEGADALGELLEQISERDEEQAP
jgi:tetraacyldisaccharide 4'-kinase